MENASKALTMAGALLISLVIISALVVLFRNISNTQKSSGKIESEKQISDFNKSFTSFEKTLYGSELLSLINKAVDYNEKNEQEGFVPIKIVFKINTGTGDDNSSSIVRSGHTYEITHKDTNRISSDLLSDISKIEKKYKGDKYLQRLIDRHNAGDEDEVKKLLDDIGTGIQYNNTTKKELSKYSEYIEFKRKKFEFKQTLFDGEQPGSTVSATNGRIVRMEYEENNGK